MTATLPGTSTDQTGAGVATATRTGTGTATTTRPVLLVVSWLVVGIPLLYGIYETVVKASSLFG